MLTQIRKFHFIGIGGAGMSALAKILLELGYPVSGSDMNKSDITVKLEKLGAHVFIGHQPENIEGAQAVVVSTAIRESNPELMAAREQNMPVFHRSDILAALMKERQGIAIAGAHGKTTTTSMIAVVMEKSQIDPTIVIGGEVDVLGSNAKLGKGKYLVAEADESDGSFLKLPAVISVVTNIENDHMDYYGTMENILHSFEKFLDNLPKDSGLAVLCFDNKYIRDIAAKLDRRFLSYALDSDAEYMACNIHMEGVLTIYDVYHKEEKLGTIRLNVPGRHNVANSLAAVVVGLSTGLKFAQIAEGLSYFHGAKRRFQTKARAKGIWIVDDYAHHPTEIAATLAAARQTNPKRLICVFQPHRYSRTNLLKKEFGGAFKNADLLILTDVYAAGETPIPGISGEVIKTEIEQQTKQQVTYIANKDQIARYLSEIAETGDLIITMGAGNIYLVGEELVEKLISQE
ncbi:MAG: UDP-N-acetylmuramate--L-alanine ligase [Pelosinus sp.]|nr:UDP-N-acetylmuramate--L-alanine ligase [Pelosinus sp.]